MSDHAGDATPRSNGSRDEQWLHELLAEWEALPRHVANVDRWQSELDDMTAEQRALRERGRWLRGRSDFFGVLGIHRSEVLHSAMIAWLLDPCARHGLGTRVLADVIRVAFGDDALAEVAEGLHAAQPRCEVTRSDRRIDVLVEGPGLLLLVENKVDAEESPGQCDAYFALFQSEPGVRFLFLTPTGRAPISASGDARHAFAALGYGALRSIIERALEDCRGDGIARPLVDDYLCTLRREFP